MTALDYALDFISFVAWLALLVFSGLFSLASLICCAPVVVLTWISKRLQKAAEAME